jgi:hypothetical protein
VLACRGTACLLAFASLQNSSCVSKASLKADRQGRRHAVVSQFSFCRWAPPIFYSGRAERSIKG